MCEGSFLPSSFGPHQKHTEFESSLRSYPINPVNAAIRSSSGNTIRRCPPKPLAIHTYRCPSARGNSHHLNPYLKPSSASINEVSDCFTQSFDTICSPSHTPSCR